MAGDPKLIDKLLTAAAPDARKIVKAAMAVARYHDLPLYVVGGPVRDLLLGSPARDIDLIIEGHAALVAGEAAGKVGAQVLKRTAFGTATVALGPATVDFAMARAETYRRPGALPTVHPATVAEDMLRRDFTINAMAITLSGEDAGTLLDPAGGQADIRARAIRVLHDASFQDDATRLIRAVRYEQRLGFSIEPHTLALLGRDRGFIATISGARLRRELQHVFAEHCNAAILQRLQELGVLAALHPALQFTTTQARALGSAEEASYHAGSAWTILAWGVPALETSSVAGRLALTRTETALVHAAPRLRDLESDLSHSLRPSQTVSLLSPFPVAALFGFAAVTGNEQVRARVLDYIRRLKQIRPSLRGDDLLALGVPAGACVGDVLARLRAAKLDGEVKSKRQEEDMVRAWLRQRKDANAR
jgi:tRNA nucleotidyltransferase (CCA-adding enzyme)